MHASSSYSFGVAPVFRAIAVHELGHRHAWPFAEASGARKAFRHTADHSITSTAQTAQRCSKHTAQSSVCAAIRQQADAALSDATAVIVVDHGSRREASNEMLFDFVEMYRYCLT